MSDAKHGAILHWLANAGMEAVTLCCQEAQLDGALVLDRCLKDAPLAWLVELATHATVHIAADHCEQAGDTRARLRNLASITGRIQLDGGPGEGPTVRYSAPPAREPGPFPLSVVTGPHGTHAERLVVALAALPRALSPAV